MMNRRSLWMRVTYAVLAVLFFVLEAPVSVRADVYWPKGPGINTPCAIVMDVNTGAVLYEKNSDEVNYPASITKILTTMVALEHSELDEVVTFSDNAIDLNQGDTSHIARDYGEQMTMEECLYAVMLESANECAYAVAEHVGQKLGGDYQTFIDLMNEKAKELGCINTHFTNANGLPDSDHWTSARDMALISAAAYKNETFRIIIGTRSYQIPPTNKHDEITPLNNHHAMISNYKTRRYLYEYCKGGKTGYTTAAGSTLVSFAEKDGLSLVCVVMRTNSVDQYIETTSLFEYCFQNFQAVSLAENEDSLKTEKNLGIMNNNQSFVEMSDSAYVVLPVGAEFSNLTQTLMNEKLPEGAIAQLQYTYGEHVVGCVEIVPSKVQVEDNYFEFANEKNQDNKINVVKIKPSAIFIVLLIIAGILGVVLFVKYFFDNYYVIVHDIQTKKERQKRFRPIRKKKKRWTKKDRMFK